MKYLVTGGAGFIGSHLCDALIDLGHEVIAIDNYITGVPENIAHLKTNPKFSFIEHDISMPLDKQIEVDAIYHLASPASPNINNEKSYINLPVETMLVNSQGTYHMLELAKSLNTKFLFASTSEIYGDPLVHPQKEDYFGNVNPIGMRSVYDESKRFGEALTMAYFRKYNVDGRIVRIFNTYGPRMFDDGRVVVNLIKQALVKVPFTVYGDGNQTRSFCYVTDLVNGLQLAMDHKETKGEVINLGNSNEMTINDLVEEIGRIMQTNVGITFEPLPQDDPKQRQPDITKAKHILGWEPKVTLEEGLIKTIEYFKNSTL